MESARQETDGQVAHEGRAGQYSHSLRRWAVADQRHQPLLSSRPAFARAGFANQHGLKPLSHPPMAKPMDHQQAQIEGPAILSVYPAVTARDHNTRSAVIRLTEAKAFCDSHWFSLNRATYLASLNSKLLRPESNSKQSTCGHPEDLSTPTWKIIGESVWAVMSTPNLIVKTDGLFDRHNVKCVGLHHQRLGDFRIQREELCQTLGHRRLTLRFDLLRCELDFQPFGDRNV